MMAWPLIVMGYDTEVMIDVMGGKDDDDRGGGMDANFTGDSCRLAMI